MRRGRVQGRVLVLIVMASAAVSSFLLPHPATLCPPPLHLQKKTRRTTVHKRMLRKPTQDHIQLTGGPLDDIIATIKSDILESPFEYNTSLSIFNPLKAPATWAVTPLPVSRAPGDQPLTIRKNRNSRSSASGSSMGSDTTPWPAFDPALAQESIDSEKSFRTRVPGAAEHVDGDAGLTSQRRPSRLRLFTNGFPRLRRIGTGETSASTGGSGDTLESISPTAATSLAIMERVVRRLPSSREDEPDPLNGQPLEAEPLPTTLRTAIRVFPEVKVLTADIQDFSVAIEIEGVLSNRNALSDGTVDVIFLVDNG
jgi:hypothetical protein